MSSCASLQEKRLGFHTSENAAFPTSGSLDTYTGYRKAIVHYAERFLGLPYIHGGRSSDGFDCSGFTSYVLEEFGVDVSPCSRTQAGQGNAIDISEVKAGDLIFFRHSRQGAISHVAMVVRHDEKVLEVIHSTSRGVVIDNLNTSKYWLPKISHARNVIE